jgi:hypothetical protein
MKLWMLGLYRFLKFRTNKGQESQGILERRRQACSNKFSFKMLSFRENKEYEGFIFTSIMQLTM